MLFVVVGILVLQQLCWCHYGCGSCSAMLVSATGVCAVIAAVAFDSSFCITAVATATATTATAAVAVVAVAVAYVSAGVAVVL